MRESPGGKPRGAVKAKAAGLDRRGGIPCRPFVGGGRTTGPSRSPSPSLAAVRRGEAEQERTRRDPKDGELCLSRTKPEETLVEVRSDSDVQIDRQTWV